MSQSSSYYYTSVQTSGTRTRESAQPSLSTPKDFDRMQVYRSEDGFRAPLANYPITLTPKLASKLARKGYISLPASTYIDPTDDEPQDDQASMYTESLSNDHPSPSSSSASDSMKDAQDPPSQSEILMRVPSLESSIFPSDSFGPTRDDGPWENYYVPSKKQLASVLLIGLLFLLSLASSPAFRDSEHPEATEGMAS